MNRLTLRSLVLRCTGLLAVVPSVASAAILIDDFASPPGGQIASDNTIDATGVASALSGQPTLGGSREIIAFKTGQIGDGAQTVKGSSNENDTEIFNFDQFSSSARGIVRLIYDGTADGTLNTQGFATGVDLTDGGTNFGFKFEDLRVTGSGLLLTVNLYNKTTGLVFSSGPQTLINEFMGELFLPFLSFSGPGGIGTITNVGAIEIIVDGSGADASGSDLTFGLASLGTPGPPGPPVPEPASMALLAAGMFMTGGYGLRKRKRMLKSESTET